jgi:hypothetical protein
MEDKEFFLSHTTSSSTISANFTIASLVKNQVTIQNLFLSTRKMVDYMKSKFRKKVNIAFNYTSLKSMSSVNTKERLKVYVDRLCF